jgi:hypothetical protein
VRGLVLLLAAGPLLAWGEAGHRAVNTLAFKGLRPEIRAFLADQAERIRDLAPEADRARPHDVKEGPRHYLNVEFYGTVEDIPRDAGAALAFAKARGFQFERTGLVPWVIQDRAQRLAEAFRKGDAALAAEELAWLGHYVGDVHVPLHATRNHDGQETEQRGVHARWESGLVERFVDETALKVLPTESAPLDPFAWLAESFALAPSVLAHDLEAGRGEERARPQRSSAYWKNFWALEQGTVTHRLEQAALRLRELVERAWDDAKRGGPTRLSTPSA